MSSQESEITEDWGELKCPTDPAVPVTRLAKSKIVIGRARNCDVYLNSRHVSGHHCYLTREDNGEVWIYDTSTNGTSINSTIHLSKGERYLLSSGDELFLGMKRTNPSANVTLAFTDFGKRNASIDTTQEYDVTVNNSNPEENEPAFKRQKCSSPPRSPVHAQPLPASLSTDPPKEGESSKENNVVPPTASIDAIEESLLCSICHEILFDCVSLQPCLHCFCAGCYSPWMKQSNECPQCRTNVVRISKNHLLNNLVEAYLKTHPEKRRSDSAIADLMAQNVLSKEMLYPTKARDSFTAIDSDDDSLDSVSSYSVFSESNCSCITCNSSSQTSNVIVVNSGTYGSGPPSRCRLCPQVSQPTHSSRCMYVNSPSNISATVFQDTLRNCRAQTTAINDGASTSSGSIRTTAPTPKSPSAAVAAAAVAPSAVGDNPSRNVPAFTCGHGQSHILCQCCFELMPDRRSEQYSDDTSQQFIDFPSQNCSRCYRLFCNLFWGCKKPGCFGCLNTFERMNFGDGCLNMIINENLYESDILRDYLTNKGKTWRDLLQSCIRRMESKQYTCLPTVNAKTVLCYPCALTSFRQLAYQYRSDIPRHLLPAEVTSRPDCYWGKNCRTQKNKLHHAQRFNHICLQTRLD